MTRTRAELENCPTTLYRAFGGSRLLYIGIAVNWPRRWDKHRQTSPWFADVDRVEVRAYPTRSAAEEAERLAIHAENPEHNIEHTPKDTRPARFKKGGTVTYRTDNLSLRPDSLVGSWFYGSQIRQWQGQVVAEVAPGHFLCELYSWMGGVTHQRVVPVEDMVAGEWTFYDTVEWWDESRDDVQSKWEIGR